MTDAAITKAWTKSIIDSVMLAAQNKAHPDVFLVSPYVKAVFVVTDTSIQEKWDWRRTKRELRRIGLKRKGVRREYHKRP